MLAKELDARRLVFVDEMGTNTSLAPLYASLSERTKGTLLGASQPRAQHDAAFEHDPRRHGGFAD
jgi:hypothetical protein